MPIPKAIVAMTTRDCSHFKQYKDLRFVIIFSYAGEHVTQPEFWDVWCILGVDKSWPQAKDKCQHT